MKSPIALFASRLIDTRRLYSDVKGLDRDLFTIEWRFENEGYGFLTVALPALDEALLSGLSSGKFACPYGFKTVKGGTLPRLFSGLFCKVFEPLTGWLKEDADIGIIQELHQLLRLFKKMQLDSSLEKVLHEEAVTEFYRCDDVADQVILPGVLDHQVGLVSKLILNDLSSKPFNTMTYKHGPGAVEEGYRANQKWLALSNAIQNEAFDVHTYGYGDFGVLLSELADRAETTDSHDALAYYDGASGRTAKLITVAKNSTSRRTITVEPLLNQFIQQGLNTALRDSINECRVLRNCLALTDQSKNQHLALEGSLYDNWATIDLKSASDLLSVKLVESVFRHHGSFLDRMMDCRSGFIRSDRFDGPRRLAKFAGMGNALTFPVQSVCFAVVCIAAILHADQSKVNYWTVRSASRRIRVYGDDIIIQTKYAHQCVTWLHEAGLKVNLKKSFLQGNFKESCGVDAFKGVNVTPLYVRHRPDQISTKPEFIAHYTALSNQAWLQGLYSFATWLKDDVEERLRKRLPLVHSQSGLLGWHTRQESMDAHRWCSKTHQLLTKSFALKPLKRRDRLDGYAALLKYFHVPSKDVELDLNPLDIPIRDLDHLENSLIRFRSRIVSRWVPTR
jgi:hypothetical protein